jgi:hypothetical protein
VKQLLTQDCACSFLCQAAGENLVRAVPAFCEALSSRDDEALAAEAAADSRPAVYFDVLGLYMVSESTRRRETCTMHLADGRTDRDRWLF